MKRATAILFLFNACIAMPLAIAAAYTGIWWLAAMLFVLFVFCVLAWHSWTNQKTHEWVSEHEAEDIPWRHE